MRVKLSECEAREYDSDTTGSSVDESALLNNKADANSSEED